MPFQSKENVIFDKKRALQKGCFRSFAEKDRGPDPQTRPVYKLLDNFSATLDFFGNFQVVEQFSMHRATSTFLCLYSHSHAPAMSEAI